MKKLLNTLYIFTEDAYLSLNGENVVIWQNETKLGRIPLHTLESIISFSYKGASPALMGKCVEQQIELSFFSPGGRFLARAGGGPRGNVLLRRRQYAAADSPNESLRIAKNFIIGKIYNARWVLERTTRDHALSVDVSKLHEASVGLKNALQSVRDCEDMDSMRGIEGEAASTYFSAFDEMILHPDPQFHFSTRNRRPPLDRVNALLSFAYQLLANNCAAALESVGLDPYVGMMHTDRPGRKSLALDLMEELRAVVADRFVLTGINNRIFSADMFISMENGAVLLNDAGRRAFFGAWKERRNDKITHPFLREKISWGLLPYVQALLLARYLRGDLDDYPPFLWK